MTHTSRGAPRDTDNVFLAVFSTPLLRYTYPEWDALSKRDRLRLIRTHRPTATATRRTHNVTCTELHAFLPQVIDPETNVTDSAATLAVGSDDSAFSASDTALNNETGQVDVTDTALDLSNGEVMLSTFIDSTELNGTTIAECGVVSAKDRLFNHADVSPNVSKTNSKTVVIDVILGFA